MSRTMASHVNPNQLDIGELVVNNGQVSYVLQDCASVPEEIMSKFGERIKRLDLSHNKIRSPRGLLLFTTLDEVVLDDNEITDHSLGLLPDLPNLRSLTLNKNKIQDLDIAVDAMCKHCPNLTYLSLLGNDCCPDQLSPSNRNCTYEDYNRYRLRVISSLRCLKFLDSRPVSDEERQYAIERSPYLRMVRYTDHETDSHSVSDDGSLDSDDYHRYSPLPVNMPCSSPKTL